MLNTEPHKLNERGDLTEDQYRYGCFDQALVYTITLATGVWALFLFADLIVGACNMVMGHTLSIGELATTGGNSLLLMLLSLAFSSAYPSFRISRSGLTVQVFLFWWAFLPWDDIQEVRNTLAGNTLVIVRRLTPMHRLYGWVFGLTLRPGFVIRKHIEGYDKAIKTIQQNATRRSS